MPKNTSSPAWETSATAFMGREPCSDADEQVKSAGERLDSMGVVATPPEGDPSGNGARVT
jgi:hypothetical protein